MTKIRIFALARDLGLDSKVLIELCEEAGVKLKNALATISEEERDQVVAYVQKKGGSSVVDTSAAPDLAPVREAVSSTGKVRVIGGAPSRSKGSAFDHDGDVSAAEAEFESVLPAVEPVAEEVAVEPEVTVVAEIAEAVIGTVSPEPIETSDAETEASSAAGVAAVVPSAPSTTGPSVAVVESS
ncbi:MAG: translation initiation factor IF-2 N-terminal domain-containing protein [Planctomycetota bacterium]